MARGKKGLDAAASVLVALSLVGLTGCGDLLWDPDHWGLDRLDPFATNGRDGGGFSLDFDTLMRLGAASRAGGDLPNAVSLYRRASSIDGNAPAPYVGIGNTLLEMGSVDEAIVAFNAALRVQPRDPEALRGLARAYLRTGRPELAGQPLGVAFEDTPNDPKLLQLIGVADDYLDQHGEAQARYHRALELAPADPGLTVNLALSLALTGDYDQAIARLRPIAAAPSSTPRERQTLALIYGLKGDRRAAEQLGRLDLEPSVVQHNLAFYDNLRRLSPEARSRAIRALGTNPGVSRPS